MADGITPKSNQRYNIMKAFSFMVEIDGMFVGGFTQVSGLEVEVITETYNEGGLNGFQHQLVTGIKYSPIVLKRGIANSSLFLDWCQSVIKGNILRMNGAIVLLGKEGKEDCRWSFFDAYPIKWSGPELNAMSNDVAIESITLVHNGIKRIKLSL